MTRYTTRLAVVLTGVLVTVVTPALLLQPVFGEGGARRDVVRDTEKRARAESAGPASLSKNATIMELAGTVLREGANGWTCVPDNPNTPGTDPWCMNEPWLNFRDAVKTKKNPTYTQVGIAYMLQGDTPVSNIDPYTKGPTPGDDWIEGLGAHIMILVPDVATLKNISTDSKNGGPWVMWPDTPYAHLMIPIDSYPAQ